MKTQDKIHDERIIAVCRPTFLASIPAFLFVALVALAVAMGSPTLAVMVAVVGFVVVSVRASLARISAKYTVSTFRIVTQTGLLSIRTTEVRIPDVRGISVRKSLLGRILGYSSAAIGTAATAGAEIRIVNVRGLDAILAEIDSLRSQQEPPSATKTVPADESRIIYDAKTHQYVKV